jgi:hypothetical protein
MRRREGWGIWMSQIDKLKYFIVPGSCGPKEAYREVYLSAYTFWRDFWGGFYADSHSSEKLDPNEFMRQSYVAGLQDEQGRTVAVHLYSCFGIQDALSRDHAYFARYDAEAFRSLQRRGLRDVFTAEYFACDPAYRKSVVGVSLAEVMAACGMRLFLATEMDVAVTLARKDIKVPEMSQRLGFEILVDDLVRHNFPCALMTVTPNTLREHPSADVRRWTDHLWDHRYDYTLRTLGVQRRAA